MIVRHRLEIGNAVAFTPEIGFVLQSAMERGGRSLFFPQEKR